MRPRSAADLEAAPNRLDPVRLIAIAEGRIPQSVPLRDAHQYADRHANRDANRDADIDSTARAGPLAGDSPRSIVARGGARCDRDLELPAISRGSVARNFATNLGARCPWWFSPRLNRAARKNAKVNAHSHHQPSRVERVMACRAPAREAHVGRRPSRHRLRVTIVV